MSRLASSVAFSVAAFALFSGCGGSNPLGRKAISGNVTLNGSPVNNGSIEFEPLQEGGVSSGGVITGGGYSIPAEQGLPIGKYRVVIFATPEAPPLPPGHMPGDDLPVAKQLIPLDWNKNSKKSIDVTKEGPHEYSFDITTKNR